jgi:hypothetical protein
MKQKDFFPVDSWVMSASSSFFQDFVDRTALGNTLSIHTK